MLGRSEDPGEDAQAVWNQTLSSEAAGPTHVWMSFDVFLKRYQSLWKLYGQDLEASSHRVDPSIPIAWPSKLNVLCL